MLGRCLVGLLLVGTAACSTGAPVITGSGANTPAAEESLPAFPVASFEAMGARAEAARLVVHSETESDVEFSLHYENLEKAGSTVSIEHARAHIDVRGQKLGAQSVATYEAPGCTLHFEHTQQPRNRSIFVRADACEKLGPNSRLGVSYRDTSAYAAHEGHYTNRTGRTVLSLTDVARPGEHRTVLQFLRWGANGFLATAGRADPSFEGSAVAMAGDTATFRAAGCDLSVQFEGHTARVTRSGSCKSFSPVSGVDELDVEGTYERW